MNLNKKSWRQLLDPEVRLFIRSHESADVRDLGLKASPVLEWPYALILDQIKARQKARVKLPDWLGREALIFPVSAILEQASSMPTARYKSGLVRGKNFVDLTAGAGVDGVALSENFESGTLVEIDADAADRLAHNVQLLTNKPVGIENISAEEFVKQMGPVDLVYIDPQRRNDSRKGLYRLEDCAPDILALMPDIRQKAGCLMIKTSPMLDIEQALTTLEHVSAIHIIEWQGECKEIVYIVDFQQNLTREDVPFKAVMLDDEGTVMQMLEFTKAEEASVTAPLSQPLAYLYEPGPAFMKSGAFNVIAQRYGLHKLHTSTHLYTSEHYVAEFPGRSFEIIATLSVNRKALTMNKANLAIRNFPSDVEHLKKKLKIKDGGEDYLFACTLMENQKVLIHGRKIKIF